MKEIYLDNSATTMADPEVVALMSEIMLRGYGNPASLHQKGVEAEKYVRRAKEQIAATLKCDPKSVYFTSGGTESNNWALRSAAEAYKRSGRHLITTAVEHPSVKNPMKALAEQGYEVTYLPVGREGQVSLEDLKSSLRPDTILVSVMYVNNEIGAVEPVEEIGAFLKSQYPDVLFHVDAIQAYGKYEIFPKRLGIDFLSVSGHKIHGPKGVGFLYVSDRVRLKPMILGGGQQKGMRSGTENVPGEAGLGLAAEKAFRDLKKNREILYQRKAQLTEGLRTIPDVSLNGFTDERSAPHIVSCSFRGVRSEVLLHALEDRGIFVSSGSACASSHPSEVSTLLAIGLRPEEQEGTIRFSMSEQTTEEEIRETIQALRELLPVLRRFTRR